MAKKVREKRKAEADPTRAALKKTEPKKAAPPPTEPDVAEPNDGDDDAAERALVVAEKGELTEADDAPSDALDAAREGDETDEEAAAGQLGSQRYVMAGFFVAGLIAAYVFGKLVHGIWAYVSNKDWFSQTFPVLTAVSDDDKTTYGTILGAILALVFMLRTYRKAEVRAWSEDVAAELAKVKWPTKKDVSNSTIVVIAASTIATVYLALLDRLWAAVTNLVYGTGI
jgi:preprotein translocase subunit SecE